MWFLSAKQAKRIMLIKNTYFDRMDFKKSDLSEKFEFVH